MGERTNDVCDHDLGEVLNVLSATIADRARDHSEESYTSRLLQGSDDQLYKKVIEEASELIMAAKDKDHDHIRYEAADLIYHVMVVLKKFDISLEQLGGELKARMK